MKVAIVHDWLTSYGGAETFVELLLRIYPDADIFTLVYDKKRIGNHFRNNKIYTSPLQKIPFAPRIYTKLLTFMPKAVESFDFTGYDLVICSSSCCAKGVITPPSVPQIAYIHTPMRYAWDLFFEYQKRSNALVRHFMNKWMGGIRQWDYISSQRIDTLVANSNYIARRIKKYWNRDAQVIYSPVNTRRFFPADFRYEDFYVAFSRLVPYKRMDLAVQACMSLGRKLVVIGSGPENKNLKKLAGGCSTITFTGRVSDEVLRVYLQKCRALIFCAEEDFGLVPLEAQACGRPVIAFGKGGACETVKAGKTGVFFKEQTVDSVVQAVREFEKLEESDAFDGRIIAAHAVSFSEERFITEFKSAVSSTVERVTANLNL
ncbi:MAG: glycosyltransferase [Treponema sp.]|nr:glycosyltransferase [Treponema sp.]